MPLSTVFWSAIGLAATRILPVAGSFVLVKMTGNVVIFLLQASEPRQRIEARHAGPQ
jgi:hypothetical protein